MEGTGVVVRVMATRPHRLCMPHQIDGDTSRIDLTHDMCCFDIVGRRNKIKSTETRLKMKITNRSFVRI